MGLTYWSVRDRARFSRGRQAFLSRGEAILAVVSLVSALAVAVAYSGRLRAFDAAEAERGGAAPVNLNAQADVETLERALAPVFERPADRRFAAREWAAAMATAPPLVNVGALMQLTVPAAAIDRAPRLETFARRLADARSAARDGIPVETVPLFTSADFAVLKPLVAVRGREDHARTVFWSAVAIVVPFHIVSLVWRFRSFQGDRVMLAAAHLLTAIGFLVMLSRPDPLRDTVLVARFAEGVVVALGACLAASFVSLRAASFLQLSYLPLAAAVILCVTLILFGAGPGTSGARINLGPVQPGEAIRLLLSFFLAGYFARRWELIRQVRSDQVRGRPLPGWLNVPRLDLVLPVLAGVALSLGLFFLQRDLGPALLVALMFLVMAGVARGGAGLSLAGFGVLVAGIYAGHAVGISGTLSARIAMWLAPWDNAVRGGDQVAHAAWALASGGVDGAGVGLGSTRFLPAGHTDLVLASVGEELGLVGVLVTAIALAVIVWRGLRSAIAASSDYACFLAVALSLTIALPALVMAAGLLGLIPLTGLVTPFVSYGGSAMTANFAALGLLTAVSAHAAPRAALDPLRVPVRRLATGLAVVAAVLVGVVVRTQAVSADDVIVRPQLSRQADGGLRYQYNPRVLEAARRLPRGTIFDRGDLPLATDDAAVLARSVDAYARVGIAVKDACPDGSTSRCYPLGGAAFHMVGDARSRVNWAASNSSYVERDAEDGLRGFDDRATIVRAEDATGAPFAAIRRDYRDLTPLVRHRWEPDHPDVRALVERSRDVHLTIDARLQHQTAAILARAARAAGVAHAAAVVLDAATGQILASVSYPWPEAHTPGVAAGNVLLDRARYGLYPPGSTFKLVTAAAALRQDAGWRDMPLVCSRLPGDRAGVRIPGFGPPVRDDIRDRQPHGAIAMHDGLVRSCNAYFAQLAVRLGPEALAATAELAGVPLAPTPAAARSRDQLPHAGYGQGQVVATPLRMARIAAAIGSDGVIRQAPIVKDRGDTVATPFLGAAAARLLAGDMRDAVTQGTGRLLRDHPSRIAGKTGTAEVDDAASHAWFVGFAPHGPANRRVAFAVLLENAGYGGVSAASVAGQIVTAAAALGWIR